MYEQIDVLLVVLKAFATANGVDLYGHFLRTQPPDDGAHASFEK